MKVQSIKIYPINILKNKPLNKEFISKSREISFSGNDNTNKLVSAINLPSKGIDILFHQSSSVNNNIASNNSAKEITAADVYNKIQQQLSVKKEDEILNIVQGIEQFGINKDEALYALQKLTQFGNVKSLQKLGEQFREHGIRGFYNTKMLSCNTTFNYLYNYKFFKELGGNKTAYILDEGGLRYLENDKEKVKILQGKKDTIFINIEGWNNGINIYSQGKSNDEIRDIAISTIKEAKEFQKNTNTDFKTAFDNVVNKQVLDRAKKLGITNVITIHADDKNPDIQTITDNLSPLNIKEEELNNIFNSISEVLYPNDKNQQQRANQLLFSYFNEQVEIYSPERLGKALKKKHQDLLDYVSQQKKSDGSNFNETDIIYIMPERMRSFDQISLQYATVNNIPLERFKGNEEIESDKIYVVLDDVIGSGDTMLSKDFGYSCKEINPNVKNYHIIMAPVTANQMGIDNIRREIKKSGREGQDIVLIEPESIKPKLGDCEFYKELDLDSKAMLLDIFNSVETSSNFNDGLGFNRSGTAFLFPYMGPDNNSVLTSFIFEKLVPNRFCLKSCYSAVDIKTNDILQRIKEYNMDMK